MISGLHITLLGTGILKLLRKIGFHYLIACFISFALIIAYFFLTGYSVSSFRAVSMFVIYIIGQILGKSYDTLTALTSAAAILLIKNPYITYGTGFWLSFGAVFTLTVLRPLLEDFLKVRSKLGRALLASICIQIVMLPVMLTAFYEISPYSIILNLVIIPLMPILLGGGILGCIAGFVNTSLGTLAMAPSYYILRIYKSLCSAVMRLPYSNLIMGKPVMIQCVLYYICIGLFFLLISKCLKKELINRNDKDCQEIETGDLQISKRANREINKEIKKQRKVKRKIKREINRKINSRTKETININEDMHKLKRIFLCGIICIVLTSIISFRRYNSLNLTFLDVGQGDSIVIETSQRTVYLIDGGSTDTQSVGQYRIMPYLKSRGIASIDYAVVTHADADHINGIAEIIEKQKVLKPDIILGQYQDLYIHNLVLPLITLKDESYLDLEKSAAEAGISVIYMSRGTSWQDGQTSFQCLHPYENFSHSTKNEYSTVLFMEHQGFKALFTGDIEGKGENELKRYLKTKAVQQHLEPQYSESMHSGSQHVASRYSDLHLLKVAHHGSGYSTDQEFLQILTPEYAIISCGKNNRYGHPHPDLINRLKVENIKIYTTSQEGAIQLRIKGGEVKITPYF